MRHSTSKIFLVLTALFLLAVSCGKAEKGEDAPVLSLSPETTLLRFSADGHTVYNARGERVVPSFVVTTNQDGWDVEIEPQDVSWCHLLRAEDSRGFSVSVDENTSKEAREEVTLIVVSGAATPVEIAVSQNGVAENTLILSPDTRNIEFPVDGGSSTFTVETDASSWSAVSDTDWCMVETDTIESAFTVTVYRNESTEDLGEAAVTVTAGNAEPLVISVTVETRNTLCLSPSDETVKLPADGGSSTITVTTNASSWNVDSESDWCSVEKDGNSFTISAGRNDTGFDREPASLTVTAGNATVNLVVTQSSTGAVVTYKLGDYWPDPAAIYENGVLVSGTAAQGIVIWLDPTSGGTHGTVVSIASGGELFWGNENGFTGATDLYDGMANMEALSDCISASASLTWEDFPMFYWVVSELNGRQEWVDGDSWYIPSLNELRQICAGMFGKVWEDLTWDIGDQYSILPGYNEEDAQASKAAFNEKRVAAGGVAIDGYLWCSTEDAENENWAYAINMNFGQWDNTWSKNYDLGTCAIRKF